MWLFCPLLSRSRQGFPTWTGVGCQFRASFCHLLPLRSTASRGRTAQPHAQLSGLWQQDLGFCSRLDGLIIVIHQEIVGNNLFAVVIMLYGSDALKCF